MQAIKDIQFLLLPPPLAWALPSPGLFSVLKVMLEGADLWGRHTS